VRSVVKSRPLRQLLEAVELEGVLVQADAPGGPFPEHLMLSSSDRSTLAITALASKAARN